MHRGWGGYAAFAALTAALLACDHFLTGMVGSFEMLSPQSGLASGLDRAVFNEVEEARRRIALQQRIDREKDPAAHARLSYELLDMLKKTADRKPADRAARQAATDYRMLVDELAARLAEQPLGVRANQLLFDACTAEKNATGQMQAFGRLTNIAARYAPDARTAQGIYLDLAKRSMLAGRHREAFEMMESALARFPGDEALLRVQFELCAITKNPDRARQIDAALKRAAKQRADLQAQESQFRSIQSLAAAGEFDKAEAILAMLRSVSTDPVTIGQINARWCLALLNLGAKDRLLAALPEVLEEQYRLLDQGKKILPEPQGILLILPVFEMLRARGDGATMRRVLKIVEAVSPVHAPWFAGETWLAEGATGPEPKPVVRVRFADMSAFTPDAADCESAWSGVTPVPGPYFHYDDLIKWQEAAPAKTLLPSVRFVHDGTRLYVFARFPEPNPAGILAAAQDAEVNLWKDDGMELFFFPERSMLEYRQVIINTRGSACLLTMATAALTNNYLSMGTASAPEHPADLLTSAQVGTDSWSLEAAIPLSEIGLSWTGEPLVFGGAFRRNRYVERDTKRLESWSMPKVLMSTHYQQTFAFFVLEPPQGGDIH